VPLVEAGHKRGSEERDGGPAQRPLRPADCWQRGSPGAKQQDTHDGIAYDVACFSNIEMPLLKMIPAETKEKMQQGIENPAGVIRGEECCGFNRDDNEPKNRGDPGFQKMVPVGVQSSRLLDAIIGSLARDHYVVDMALAKSRTADAHEARLLQKLGDGCAAAITHA